jgi:hypothetical protein
MKRMIAIALVRLLVATGGVLRHPVSSKSREFGEVGRSSRTKSDARIFDR